MDSTPCSGWPGVQHRIDAPVQVFQHVLRRGGADVAKVLALGAATGTPARRINSSATGCAGMRTPTSGRPAVTASGTALVRGSSRVSGPGQKACISLRAASGTSMTSPSSIARLEICTITGSHAGRCLASEDAFHRGRVQSIGAQPVDGLRGQGHQSSGAQNLRRPLQSFLGAGSIQMRGVHHQSLRSSHLLLSPFQIGRRHLPYTHCNRCLSRPRSNSASRTWPA